MSQLEQNEQLDKYFLGEMSPAEEKQFLAEVESNEHLKALFDQHNDIIKAIEISSLKGLKEKLVDKESELSASTSGNNYSFYLKIAAGFAILVVATWYLIGLSSSSVNSAELYMSYYEPYPNVIAPIDRSSTNGNTTAFGLYELRQYEEALTLINNSEENDTTYFYKGQIYLAMDKTEMAIENLLQVDTGSSFKEASSWYLALCHLKLEDTSAAKRVLNEIKEDDGAYKQRAMDLLNEL